MTLYKKTLFILISGKAGVGKTTTAGILEKLMHDDKFYPYADSFAMGVKQTAYSMGWDGKKDQRGRAFLQKIGQLGREYNENVWVNQLVNRYREAAIIPFDAIIVDDWRFKNEMFRVRDISTSLITEGITIRIESPEREMLKGTPEYNEISEISLASTQEERLTYAEVGLYNYIIQNIGTIDELKTKIEKVYDNLKHLREIIHD